MILLSCPGLSFSSRVGERVSKSLGSIQFRYKLSVEAAQQLAAAWDSLQQLGTAGQGDSTFSIEPGTEAHNSQHSALVIHYLGQIRYWFKLSETRHFRLQTQLQDKNIFCVFFKTVWMPLSRAPKGSGG